MNRNSYCCCWLLGAFIHFSFTGNERGRSCGNVRFINVVGFPLNTKAFFGDIYFLFLSSVENHLMVEICDTTVLLFVILLLDFSVALHFVWFIVHTLSSTCLSPLLRIQNISQHFLMLFVFLLELMLKKRILLFQDVVLFDFKLVLFF